MGVLQELQVLADFQHSILPILRVLATLRCSVLRILSVLKYLGFDTADTACFRSTSRIGIEDAAVLAAFRPAVLLVVAVLAPLTNNSSVVEPIASEDRSDHFI